MRLGFLCSEYPPEPHGGIGTFVHALAHQLAGEGHEVFVIGYGRTARRGTDGRVNVHLFAPPGEGLPRHAGAFWRRLWLGRAVARAVRAWRLDLLEVPDYHGEAAFLPRLPCPVLVRCHGAVTALAPLAGRRPSRMIRWFEGRTLRRADARVSVSRFLARRMHRAFPRLPPPNSIVPNAVGRRFLAEERDERRDPRQLLFAGRYTQQKGFHRLAGIIAPVLRRHGDATLHVAGDEAEAPLARLRGELGEALAPRVRHHGRLTQDALAGVYTKSSLLLLPSRAEAFSLVTLEAMACGCLPVVAAGSGPAEIVKSCGAGRILPARDMGQWATLLASLLEDPSALGEERHTARSRVAAIHHPDVLLGHNLDVYHEVIRRWRGTP